MYRFPFAIKDTLARLKCSTLSAEMVVIHTLPRSFPPRGIFIPVTSVFDCDSSFIPAPNIRTLLQFERCGGNNAFDLYELVRPDEPTSPEYVSTEENALQALY